MTTLVLCLMLAQNFDWKSLDHLGAIAKDKVDVDLEGPLLQLAAAFLSKDDPGEARVRKVVAGLTGIHVKSYTFDKEGQYTDDDLDMVRSQWKTAGWSRIVGVSAKSRELTEVYLRTGGGIGLITASKREVTVVQLLGKVKLEDVRDLAGNFGIPKLPSIELEKK